jgi:hypothetical protein
VHGRRRLGGQRAERRQGLEGGGEQPVVATVGRRGDHAQRDAVGFDRDRAFAALLGTVDGAWTGGLAAAGRFGDAAVHGEMGQLKAEQTVVGAQDEQAQLLGNAEGDPLVAAATQGGC